jgi:hypothetical protein
MQVAELQPDVFQFGACIVFGLQEAHPHVVCVVIDDEQAVAEAMWRWYIHMAPSV